MLHESWPTWFVKRITYQFGGSDRLTFHEGTSTQRFQVEHPLPHCHFRVGSWEACCTQLCFFTQFCDGDFFTHVMMTMLKQVITNASIMERIQASWPTGSFQSTSWPVILWAWPVIRVPLLRTAVAMGYSILRKKQDDRTSKLLPQRKALWERPNRNFIFFNGANGPNDFVNLQHSSTTKGWPLRTNLYHS